MNCHIRVVKSIALIIALCSNVAAAQLNSQMLAALVLENQQKFELPRPLLETMLNQGANLEQVAAVTVGNAISPVYAEAYTHYAICMAVSERQAQDIHDIVIASAQDSVKPSVLVEARYTLDNFMENRCESDTLASRQAPQANATTENTVGGRASISQ